MVVSTEPSTLSAAPAFDSHITAAQFAQFSAEEKEAVKAAGFVVIGEEEEEKKGEEGRPTTTTTAATSGKPKKPKAAWQLEDEERKRKNEKAKVVDTVGDAREAAAQEARKNAVKPRTAFPSGPQEWWFDKDTSVVYTVLLGPPLVLTPSGAMRKADVVAAGVAITSARGGGAERTEIQCL